MNMFSRETYAQVLRPLTQAEPLPGWCYASPEWHEREIDAIFRKEWLCVGRVDQVPNPGDFYSIPLLGQPLVITRDHENEVNVLSAVCRHRGAIITEGEGRCRQFMCPYHNWTYALDGSLINTPGLPPPMDASVGFDKSHYHLTRIRHDVWAGFIFVTFDAHAKPLLESLGTLPSFLENYRLERMQFVRRDVYEVDCNWKVWLENAFENYHVPTIHRKHVDPSKPQNWEFEESDGRWEAMYSARSIVAHTGLPTMSGLSDRQAGGLFHVWVAPSLHLVLTASFARYLLYLPEGPNKFRLMVNWTFPKAAIERPDFTEIVKRDYWDKFAEVFREDLRIATNVQRGMRSRAFQPGRLSVEEYIVHRIANYVVGRVVAE